MWGVIRLVDIRLGVIRLGVIRLGDLRLGDIRLGVLRLVDIRLRVIRLGDIRLRDGEGLDEWHRRMGLKWKAVKRRVHPSWLNISGTSVCAKHLCHPSRRHPSRGLSLIHI